jgi:cbb3-type cytochrome oxidase maturation protein
MLPNSFERFMNAFFVLILCSLVVAVAFLVAFLINLRKGQFDDLYTPSIRMLFEEKKPEDDHNNPSSS